jgi:sporulation protein YlmC with PRC-barrel domain
MLQNVSELSGYCLLARDGEIGKVSEFYFDDKSWAIRYLVVDTGPWLFERKVVISPYALGQPEREKQCFPVNLSKEQVENAPEADTESPVSRQHEVDLHQYYGWPLYWASVPGGVFPIGVPPMPPLETQEDEEAKAKTHPSSEEKRLDPHLRSTQEVIGYYITAKDGDIGHIEDIIIDDETWGIQFVVVDTKNWWPGKKVVLSPIQIERVSWQEQRVHLNITQERVQRSPEFNPSEPISWQERTEK